MTKKEEIFNARPYMELAIEEMKKSLNEPRADGKVPPKVGAILLFPDGKIDDFKIVIKSRVRHCRLFL